MKVVVQRVKSANVIVGNKQISAINKGLVLLVGFKTGDTEKIVSQMAEKIANLRIFEDSKNKMNLSVLNANGNVLVIPQFTLIAALKGQNRPYFGDAQKPELAQKLFNSFITELKNTGIKKVAQGKFGAYMQVSLINDGPVTIVIDSNDL